MIYGIGSDIVDIERIRHILARYGDRFVQRVFTPAERQAAAGDYAVRTGNPAAYFAKRFAAKEALSKAVGMGLKSLGAGAQNGLSLQEISVRNRQNGRPYLLIEGAAAKLLAEKLPEGCRLYLHLSLSDEAHFAQAFVIAELIEV